MRSSSSLLVRCFWSAERASEYLPVPHDRRQLKRHKYSNFKDFWEQLKPGYTTLSKPVSHRPFLWSMAVTCQQAVKPRSCATTAGIKLHAPEAK